MTPRAVIIGAGLQVCRQHTNLRVADTRVLCWRTGRRPVKNTFASRLSVRYRRTKVF